MSYTTLSCYLDYHNYSFKNHEHIKEIITSKINEICSANDLIIPLQEFGNVMAKPEIIRKENLNNEMKLVKAIDNDKTLGIPNMKSFLSSDLLKFEIKVEIPSYVDSNFEQMITEVDPKFFENVSIEENNKLLINIIFQKRIFDIVVTANLSQLGSLPVVKGILLQDEDEYSTGIKDIYSSNLYTASEYASKWGYPLLRNINFNSTWNWLTKQKDYLTGFSSSRTGRALSSFSYLLDKDYTNLLFRSIMGIEALYAKGTGSLQQQVREKSQVVLGKQEGFKKVYTNMYNFRSRYIHGDLDFPTNHSLDMTNKTMNYNKDIQDATYFAISMLGASLQELVIRDWSGFDFSYIVNSQV